MGSRARSSPCSAQMAATVGNRRWTSAGSRWRRSSVTSAADLARAAVDGARHHVAGAELGHRVLVRHEAVAVGVAQDRALAADGLADQPQGALAEGEGGGVELDELQVGERGAGAGGQGGAVGGGAERVRRPRVQVAGAAGGQHHRTGPPRDLAAVRGRGSAGRRRARGGRRPPGPSPPPRSATRGSRRRAPASAATMCAPVASPPACTTRAAEWAPSRPSSSPPRGSRSNRTPRRSRRLDLGRALRADPGDRLDVAEAGAGREGVGDVRVNRVARVDRRGDARPGRGGCCPRRGRPSSRATTGPLSAAARARSPPAMPLPTTITGSLSGTSHQFVVPLTETARRIGVSATIARRGGCGPRRLEVHDAAALHCRAVSIRVSPRLEAIPRYEPGPHDGRGPGPLRAGGGGEAGVQREPLPADARGGRGGHGRDRRPQPLPRRPGARPAPGAGGAPRGGPGRGGHRQRLLRVDPLRGAGAARPGDERRPRRPVLRALPAPRHGGGRARRGGAARRPTWGTTSTRWRRRWTRPPASSSSATRTTRRASTARPTRSSASSTGCPRTSRSWWTRPTSTSSTVPTPAARCRSRASGRTCW